MSQKVKIHWVRRDSDNPVANVLGYAMHNNMMRKYGEKHFDYDDNADIAVTITPADFFVPIPGKFNILFTMWESLDLPDSYIANLSKPDLIVVPSRFCRDVLKPHTKVPIEVCWEGIEPDRLPFAKRKFPFTIINNKLVPEGGKRFRILWIGAPNPRKGYYSMLELVKVFEHMPNFEIYIKTTAFPKSTIKEFCLINWRRIKKIFKEHKNSKAVKTQIGFIKQSFSRMRKPEYANQVQVMGICKNIIVDTRKLPFEELEQLYYSSHVFVSPHCGEGWNLPLCEAMATGLPCVATGATGCMDYFNEDVGYPVKYDIKEMELANYDVRTRVFIPDTQDLYKKVLGIFQDYSEALKRGRKASERIHNKFTWEQSALRLREIVDKYVK